MTEVVLSVLTAGLLSYLLYLLWYGAVAYTLVFIILFAVCAGFIFRRGKAHSLLALLSLFPIVISAGPVNELPVILLLSPVLAGFILFYAVMRREPIVTRETGAFFTALGVIFIWVVYGYLKDPFAFTMDNKIILKDYLAFFSGVLVFLSGLLFFKKFRVDERMFLKFVIFSAALVSILRLLTYFSGLHLPFFGEEFVYHETGEDVYAAGINRIGGIDRCCALAVPAILACYGESKKKYPLLAGFLVLAVAGGGRTIFFGILILLFVYLMIFEKKRVSFYVLSVAGLFTTSVYFLHAALPAQFSRIFRIKSLIYEDPTRVSTYAQYADIFFRHPLFGKGIRPDSEYFSGNEFVDKQLVSGGHGAYLSILAIFGLGGLFFLLVFLGLGMLKSYRLVHESRGSGPRLYADRITLFIFLSFVMTALLFLTSDNGYSNLSLYYFVGTLCGILLRKGHPSMGRIR